MKNVPKQLHHHHTRCNQSLKLARAASRRKGCNSSDDMSWTMHVSICFCESLTSTQCHHVGGNPSCRRNSILERSDLQALLWSDHLNGWVAIVCQASGTKTLQSDIASLAMFCLARQHSLGRRTKKGTVRTA